VSGACRDVRYGWGRRQTPWELVAIESAHEL
jgi:hypothetical protein